MYIKSEAIIINAPKEKIWRLWVDVEKWPLWDNDVEWAKLDGEFSEGQTGILKPKGGPASKFVITTCNKNKGFTDVSFLPLAKLSFIHEMKEEHQGIKVTHSIQISGPLAFIFSILIGNKLAKGLPSALQKLATLAEK